METEKRLAELGVELYPDIKPIGSYLPFTRCGNVIHISGQGPSIRGEYVKYIGKVGENVTKEEAKEAAAVTAANLISILKKATASNRSSASTATSTARRTSPSSPTSSTGPRTCW